MAELRQAYADGRLILFAGAGVSAGLGLPTAPEFAEWIARQLEQDPKAFCEYGDVQTLAEYYRLRLGAEQLHEWLLKEWNQRDVDVGASEIHRLIVQGRFHAIYTTNFDHWLEAAHEHHGRPYLKVTGVKDLAALAETDVRPIIKFHGDLDDPASLVLGESGYFERLGFDTPLDLRLRADLLVRPVLFIGYSISDINIRMLFWKLARLWESPRDVCHRPPSYLFWHQDNPVARAVLAQWGIRVVSSQEADPGQALLHFMRDLASS
ncbi:Sir2 family NAD-dependent protein deacetylase [Bordetella bronchialis]|uniref:Sir2 family NAD-dependent protein deacetylase n=1 Tax=Bordetella bronchialis TaxID=463025 RepID=A0A193FQK7_9BORD|nr:Sir2 family NAD-dependent protein deacetylase [Bordetella bronchialis]ANN74618.1 Sir2 family NAD-dependent protein deacetylase [Bordetella bronchialis]